MLQISDHVHNVAKLQETLHSVICHTEDFITLQLRLYCSDERCSVCVVCHTEDTATLQLYLYQQNKLPTLTAQCSGVPNILTISHFFLLIYSMTKSVIIISEAGFLTAKNLSCIMLNIRTARFIKGKITNIHNSLLDNCEVTNMPKGPLVFNFSKAPAIVLNA